MQPKKSKNTDSDKLWAEGFRELIARKTSSPEGEGWLTLKEICQKTGVGESKTRHFLKAKLDSGDFECFRGSVLTSGASGHHGQMVWYRPLRK